jgi:hypothetical protein
MKAQIDKEQVGKIEEKRELVEQYVDKGIDREYIGSMYTEPRIERSGGVTRIVWEECEYWHCVDRVTNIFYGEDGYEYEGHYNFRIVRKYKYHCVGVGLLCQTETQMLKGVRQILKIEKVFLRWEKPDPQEKAQRDQKILEWVKETVSRIE